MSVFFIITVVLIGLSIAFVALCVSSATENIEEDNREYMDPLPPAIKMIWPMVLLFSNSIVQFYSNNYLDKLDKKLEKTGVSYILNSEQFVGLRYVVALITFGISLFLLAALKPGTWLPFLIIAPLLGYTFPLVWLIDARKRREIDVTRSLPVYLDFITMAVEAGLNLVGALQQAMNKGPEGALKIEFNILMRDLRAGVTRSDALKRMSDRLDVKEITSFVNAMIQAERMGSSMAKTLRLQANQRRSERFQRAEKQAMEAPVKLIFPLIMFIFPVTFIILGFPIVMKFLNQ